MLRYPTPTLSYPDNYTFVTTTFQLKPIYYAVQAYARGFSRGSGFMAARSRSAHRIRALIPALTVIALVLLLALIRRVTEPPPSAPRDLFPYGELRIGVDANNPPFAAATSCGDLWGLEIDLGRALGDQLGLPVRFVNLGFDGLYDVLKTDQVDALIAGVQIDLTRLNDVHYSTPYFNAGLVLVSDQGLTSMNALPGNRLAYEFGSEADTEARTWLRRVLPFQTRPYELPVNALDAVRLGDADAALVDAVSARLYLRDHPDWRASTEQVTDSLYAIATQSRHPEISAAVDHALQALIDNGTLDDLIARWL